MSTTILDFRTRRELQAAHALWKRYRPAAAPFAFKARTAAEARAWQRRTRAALAKAMGLDALHTTCALKPKLVERVDKGGYLREKILLRTGPDALMPVYLLLPKKARRPLPAVLAFHGHGYGAKEIVGLWEDGNERATPDGYQRDFAIELCARGFAVAVPEISCFGERQTDFSHLNTAIGQGVPYTCTHASMLAFHLGVSVPGMRVHDGMRLADYLETRREIDMARLGAMGISGGGMHTMFSTCIDTRIKACVISGYYSAFKDSILAMAHCVCNIVPGMWRFGEMRDLIGLVAPRPVLIEAGSYDPIFPIKAVKRAVTEAERVYAVFSAQGKVETDYFEGRHRINGAMAYDFLSREL
ncbi:acetylxylan esterase [bacterium]|nr:acetylxylan esterase [bacterium]